MPYTTRELFARLIQCEAGGEGDNGMRAVATCHHEPSTIQYGEFAVLTKGEISATSSNSTDSLTVCATSLAESQTVKTFGT